MNKLLDGITFKSYEKDLASNIKRIIGNEGGVLSKLQSDATILACFAATERTDLIDVAEEFVRSEHGDDVADAALGAASLMNMTNVYYSARSSLKGVSSELPNLKMTYMKQHNVSNDDFELYALAVSAVNGCKPCMSGHEKILLDHGVSGKVINEAIRIAAISKSFSKRR